MLLKSSLLSTVIYSYLSMLVTIKVPRTLHQETVIADLIVACGIKVNILAASLGEADRGDGWFKLEPQIKEGLAFLHNLGVELWHHNPLEDSANLW